MGHDAAAAPALIGGLALVEDGRVKAECHVVEENLAVHAADGNVMRLALEYRVCGLDRIGGRMQAASEIVEGAHRQNPHERRRSGQRMGDTRNGTIATCRHDDREAVANGLFGHGCWVASERAQFGAVAEHRHGEVKCGTHTCGRTRSGVGYDADIWPARERG